MTTRRSLFALLVLGACSTVTEPESTEVANIAPPVVATEAESVFDARAEMFARWRDEHNSAGAAYDLSSIGDAWHGESLASAFRFRIDEGGVMALNVSPETGDSVDALDGDVHQRVRLRAWGRGDTSSPGEAEVHADGNRAEIRHSSAANAEALVEWYVNGPHGLEHGFDIAARPAGNGEVTLRLSVDGSVELREDSEDRITFVNEGDAVLAYTGLIVQDATGRTLPSSMRVEDDMIALHFDDVDAEYPVVVDPWFVRNDMVPSDAGPGLRFGTAVAMDDDTAIIGALNSVYFFVLTGGMWVQAQQVPAPPGASRFGWAVAIEGDRAVVGAQYDTARGSTAGAAYTYTRSGGVWTLEQQLLGALTAPGDRFGISVDIDEDTIAVGAVNHQVLGAAHIFVRDGAAWSEQATVVREGDWTTADAFGTSVALDGDNLAMGAPSENSRRGSAYVFVRDGAGTWSQQARVTHPAPVAADDFGSDVSIVDERLVVGARSEEPGGAAQVGTISVYLRTGTTWDREAYLVHPEGEHKQAGARLDFDGTRIVAGAANSISRSASPGYAHVWGRIGSTWTLRTRLDVPGGIFGDYWGRDVAFSGLWAILVSSVTDINGADSGGARAFELVLYDDGTECENVWDCESGFCVDGVCCENGCGGGVPSDCQACTNALTGLADGSCGPIAEGSSCGDIRDTDCDAADTCDPFGRCMENIAEAGAACNDGADAPCNAPDTCDGAGECDDNIADAGELCRPVADVCDVAEFCDGSDTCPSDTFVVEGTECRAAVGACDLVEACTGVTAACPADELVMAGTTCRESRGGCDPQELCDGLSPLCQVDSLSPLGTVCRVAAGACDIGEQCDGVGDSCPADRVASTDTVCRPAGTCDAAETCDGSVNCPTDLLEPPGTQCGSGPSPCSAQDTCSALGECETNHTMDGATCDNSFCVTGGVCSAGVCGDGTDRMCPAELKCSEVAMSCVPPCGDGEIDAGEACDDGAANSDTEADACRTDCSLPTCGDAIADEAEECDDGEDNSDEEPNACRLDCAAPSCGDGVIDNGEGCDDGDLNSSDPLARCGLDCALRTCGDGVVDAGEECDDGEENADTIDACRTNCTLPLCGDGVIDTDELCDDGSLNSDTEADACRPDCMLAMCGDGVVDTGESCDEGDENSDEAGATCRTNCALRTCGDGLIDEGEECDNGDENGDEPGACRGTCVLASCGDGVLDAGEVCDEGGLNSDVRPDACRTSCEAPVCGDGVQDAGESCDDGDDNAEGARCRPGCVVATCGDGNIDAGEMCDDGDENADAPDTCRTTCALPRCGDEIVDTGEVCDDGPSGSGTCSSACVMVTTEMDAGVAMDAGSPDSGPRTDAGGEAPMSEGGGCSCRATDQRSGAATPWAFLLFGLVFARRRFR
ncbi:MAG: MYXO-CTERM sorting domain-containing protein [Polyangiales bacterium]